jgi:predicted nucleotidyltransferase
MPALSEPDQQTLSQVVDRLVGAANPLKVILFGSRARVEARPSSDIDLLVVVSSSTGVDAQWDAMLQVVGTFRPAIDLVVTTPEEMAWRSQVPFFVQYYAVRDGYTLYERA